MDSWTALFHYETQMMRLLVSVNMAFWVAGFRCYA